MNTYSKFSILHRLSAHFADDITLDPSVYFEVTLCLFILPTLGAIVFVGTVLFAWACLCFMGFELHTLARWFLHPHSAPIASVCQHFPHWCFCLSPCSLLSVFFNGIHLDFICSGACCVTWLHLHCSYFVCSVTLFVVSNLVLLAIYFVCGCLRCRTWYAVFDVAVSKCAKLTRFCLCFEVANAVEAFW